jgi:hypothetical protein
VIYDPESIFTYIDGHAEVYLAYGMRGCLARRYAGVAGESDIVLDLFEMGSPEEAFGVFTHDQDGEPAAIGKGSLFRYGWLSFWQGRWFVSVMAEKETPASREAALALGREVSGLLPSEGEEPEIMSALPASGIEPRSRRYLHDPQILRAYVPLDVEDLFELDAGTPAALGEYRRDGRKGWLVVVDYPDPSGAAQAAGRFGDRFGGSQGPWEGKEGWFGVRVRGRRLAAVVGAGSASLTDALLEEITGNDRGGTP